MQWQMLWLYTLVMLCAATCAWSSRGMRSHLLHQRRALSDGSSPPSNPPGGTSGSDALTPAPPAPGLLSLLPDLMQLSKSMKISGFSGGALNLSFTDPLPLTGNSTVANINGDAVQSDMHSSPGSITIDVTVDPTISVGGNVNIMTTQGSSSLPGLTGTSAPAVPAPGPSTVQAKAVGLASSAAIPDAPSAAALPPMLRPAASIYFDRGSRPSAADGTTGIASRDSTVSVNLEAASPLVAPPTGSSGAGLQQGQAPNPVSTLLSLSKALNMTPFPHAQPGVLLALNPGDSAGGPSANASPADLADDVLVGLRSAVETVAAAEGLAPAQAPAPQGTATPAQPAAQAAAATRQGRPTDNGGEPRYAYTWAVIMAAVSSTVSAALLLAAALALGLARTCRPARRRAPGTNADTGAAARAKEPPDGGTGGPPTVLVKPAPARGGFPDGASQRRQPGWVDAPRREFGFSLPHFSSHVAPETPRPADNHPAARAQEAGVPPGSAAISEGGSLPSSAVPLISSNGGKEVSWSSPEGSPTASTAAGLPLPWWTGPNSGPVPVASPFANAAGVPPEAGGRDDKGQQHAADHSSALPPPLASPFAKTDLPPFSMAGSRLLLQV